MSKSSLWPWTVAGKVLCPQDSPGKKNTGWVPRPSSGIFSALGLNLCHTCIGRRFFTTRPTWEAVLWCVLFLLPEMLLPLVFFLANWSPKVQLRYHLLWLSPPKPSLLQLMKEISLSPPLLSSYFMISGDYWMHWLKLDLICVTFVLLRCLL